jgi:hypothetical protein
VEQPHRPSTARAGGNKDNWHPASGAGETEKDSRSEVRTLSVGWVLCAVAPPLLEEIDSTAGSDRVSPNDARLGAATIAVAHSAATTVNITLFGDLSFSSLGSSSWSAWMCARSWCGVALANGGGAEDVP